MPGSMGILFKAAFKRNSLDHSIQFGNKYAPSCLNFAEESTNRRVLLAALTGEPKHLDYLLHFPVLHLERVEHQFE
jgi:hypothetical protein